MSVMMGLVKLIDMAKKGAKFGRLSPEWPEIENIEGAEISAAQSDITKFLSTCAPTKSVQPRIKKSGYSVSRYAGQYLWLYENFTKNSAVYNIPIAREIVGHFEPERLFSALEKLFKRHVALRGLYRLNDAEISVDIANPNSVTIEVHQEDISTADKEEQKKWVTEALKAQCSVPFDLSGELPLRCLILKKSEQHHCLFLTFHHCVVDGWTANLLLDELSCNYNSREGVTRSDSRHAFFRFLEDPFFTVGNVADSLKFWRDELHHAPAKHSLEYDIAINSADKTENIVRASMAEALQQSLTQLSRRTGTSLFTLLHTAFALLIARESGTERVVIGSPVANRSDPGLNTAIGSFVNTVAWQFQITSDESFCTLLQKSICKFARSFKHQGLPFSFLIEQLRPARGKFHPIFQIMFVCQHRKTNELNFGSAQVSALPRSYVPPKFDLVLEVISTAEGIQLEWQYNNRLFAPQRIRALAESYALLLQQIAHNPQQPVDRYILSAADDTLQLHTLSVGTEMPQFLHQNLGQWLWRAGKKYAALPALTEGARVWRYDELLKRASIIAQWLKIHTTQQALIAIDTPRGAQQAIATLGIILARCAYLPLTDGLPDKRAADILHLSGCDCVLNNASSSHSRYPSGLRTQSLKTIFSTAHQRDEFHFTPGNTDDLAYVIYTSGTTGTPKGVAVEHGAIANTLLTMNRIFNVSPQDNVLAIADLSFDLSVYDLFGSWLAGATVVTLPTISSREPAAWLNEIRQRQISIWNSVPAVLQMLVQYCEQKNITSLPGLKQIWLSGDRISPQLVVQAHRLFPNSTIISLGGATEGAIWSIHYPLTRDTQYRNAIPYGIALPNQSMWVLNEELALCGYGVTGGIFIGGAGVAREYWRDRPATNRSFVLCPESGKRLYRTGDRGRWHRNGYIEFLGREDQQVKVQGYRIELGEIESALKSSELVAEACVVCHSNGNNTRHLDAYITLTSMGKSVNYAEEQIRKHLIALLPAYMAPAHYHILERIPLSRNGKLDRSQLSQVIATHQARPLLAAVATPKLLNLQKLLAETLDCSPDQINLHASFFDNGGCSLSGIILQGRIKRTMDVELSLAEILGYQQLSSLVERIHQNRPLALSMPSEIVNQPSLATLYLVHGAGGHVHQYSSLIKKLDSQANVITIASPCLTEYEAHDALSLYQLAVSHLVSISRNERGTAIIAGWSLGGQLAVHMAALASEQGAPFAHAIAIDSPLPSSNPLEKRRFSIAQCYLNLFDSLGIARDLCQRKAKDTQNSFTDEVREYYVRNQSIVGDKINLEHAVAFCRAIKGSFELTENAGTLPQLSIPLTLWLSENRRSKHPDLMQRWKKQSSCSVQVHWCKENHYSILNNSGLQQKLHEMLGALSTSALRE